MKKILPLILISILAACSGGVEGTKENKGTKNAKENKAQKDKVDIHTAELKKPFADVVDLTKKSNLNTVEFNRVVNFLNGSEITLTGHPYAHYRGKAYEIEFKPNSTRMIDAKDNSLKNTEIYIKFKGEPKIRIMKTGDLFTVKGILEVAHSVSEYGATTRLKLKNAEFIDDIEAKTEKINSLADLNLEKPIFCGDLYSILSQHYLDLAKNKLSISGAYISTTVSKSLEGEILEIRVDLGNRDNKVGCEMLTEPNRDTLNAKRSGGKNIIIEGSFSGITFGNPRITGGLLK